MPLTYKIALRPIGLALLIRGDDTMYVKDGLVGTEHLVGAEDFETQPAAEVTAMPEGLSRAQRRRLEQQAPKDAKPRHPGVIGFGNPEPAS